VLKKEIPIGNLTDPVSFRELNALLEFSMSESGDEALKNYKKLYKKKLKENSICFLMIIFFI